MTLTQPIWLLLLLPLGLAWWCWPAPSRLLQGLRAGLVVLIVLALAGPRLMLADRAGTVVVVADRSRSMPRQAAGRQREAIELIQQQRGRRDRLGVVTFGAGAAVEQPPTRASFGGFTQSVEPDGSNLEGALSRAMSLIPEDAPGRVLVLTDGRWTGGDPQALAGRAAGREVAIDFRHLARPRVADLAIDRIASPIRVDEGESFMLHAWVRAPASQRARVRLRRGQTIIAEGRRDLQPGLNRLTFRDTAEQAGTCQYRLQVNRLAANGGQAEQDPVPENNTAHRLVGVRGNKPVLLASQTPGGGLASLLEKSGLRLAAASPAAIDWSLAGLSSYRGVLLENVPAEALGQAGMQTLARWVEQSGGGLMMSGGKQSFGPGGYFKSPIDPLLPVSMELRQEHRKFSLAIALVLDRSGSMAMPAAGGRTKMQLANLGAAQVYELLSPMDEFGALAVDSRVHEVAPLHRVGEMASIRQRLLHVQSMGGGIFVYNGLEAAAGMLARSSARTRHIILFADARDSERPGDYQQLLKECRRANITVTTIGLGTKGDVDAGLLQDIAKRGGGRSYFTKSPTRLPQLFAQDTFVVARSSFQEEPTPVKTTPVMTALTGRSFNGPPAVGGYNLAYLREGAQLAARTQDQYTAPLVAAWRAGIGRVACYTGEADGKHTGPIGDWPGMGPMLASLTRWAAPPRGRLHEEMMLTQRLDRGRYTIQLHLPPDRSAALLSERPTVTTLRGEAGREPASTTQRMRWTAPGTLTAALNLRGRETALASVHVPGHGSTTLAPVRLPYSPEFQPARAGRGEATLQTLAEATAGRDRVALGAIWQALPRRPRAVTVAHWLLIAALVLLLIEVFQRRTGLVSDLAARALPCRRAAKAAAQAEQSEAAAAEPGEPGEATDAEKRTWRERLRIRRGDRTKPGKPGGRVSPDDGQAEPASAERPADTEQPPSRQKASPESRPDRAAPSIGDALQQARNRAGQRTRKRR